MWYWVVSVVCFIASLGYLIGYRPRYKSELYEAWKSHEDTKLKLKDIEHKIDLLEANKKK